VRNSVPDLRASDVLLNTYTGEPLQVCGAVDVEVTYNEQTVVLPLVVVESKGPTLLGRDWLQHLKLDWTSIHQLHTTCAPSSLPELMQRYRSVFKNELGTIRGTSAKLHVNLQVTPKFYKPRPVPYSMKGRVEQELDRLQREGIITPVQFSDWAAPIVPVLKKDGTVRICGDYKVTVNQAAKVETYPLPRIEDLLASLAGGISFSKLDLAHAYQQLELEEESRKFVTINTHKGLFQYNRLPFGVSSAPAVFQRTMENLLQGLKRVCLP